MKYLKSMLLCVALTCIMLTTFATVAYAANESLPEVSYGKTFTFTPGSKDLFANFKSLMPGATRTQKIKLSNKTNDSAKFYLKFAVSEQDDSLTESQKELVWDLLYNQITITLIGNDGNAIYVGPIGGEKNKSKTTDDITDGVFYLCELPGNKDTEIDVDLLMNSAVDNDYQNLAGKVAWVFIVEQDNQQQQIVIDDITPLADLPGSATDITPLSRIINTADPTQLTLWISVFILANLGVVFFLSTKIKNLISKRI